MSPQLDYDWKLDLCTSLLQDHFSEADRAEKLYPHSYDQAKIYENWTANFLDILLTNKQIDRQA